MQTNEQLLDLLENYLAQRELPTEPERLYDPIRYSLAGGGKRLRPMLLMLSNGIFTDKIQHALPAAAAVEVFHNFTLLHDDIMDRSDTRRGKPAVHTRWNDNVAILSGDAMMIYAYKLLCGCDRRVLPQLLETFNETAIGVCEGQQYDMDFESRDDVTVDRYLEMIRLKTGVLLAGALKLGAICAEAQPWQAELLYNFGINVGLAFQLQDDLFDTYGDAAVFGKPIGGDILAGKKTFLLTTALKTADAATRGELLARLHDGGMSAAEKIETVRGIYDRLGVRKITEKAIADYFRNADRILNSLEVGIERIVPLQELGETLLNRKK